MNIIFIISWIIVSEKSNYSISIITEFLLYLNYQSGNKNGSVIPEFRKHYIRINAKTKTLVPLSAFVIIFCNEIVLVKSYIADVYQLYCFCCENEISCSSFRLIVFVQKYKIQLYHNHIHFQKFASISWYFDKSSKKVRLFKR